MYGTTYLYVQHDAFMIIHEGSSSGFVCKDVLMCVTWLSEMCDMTLHTCAQRVHSATQCDLWHDSFLFMRVTHVRTVNQGGLWHDSFTLVTWLVHDVCVTWLIHDVCSSGSCDMSHSYVWHDSFRTLSDVGHDSFIGDLAQSHVWHDLFMRSAALDLLIDLY